MKFKKRTEIVILAVMAVVFCAGCAPKPTEKLITDFKTFRDLPETADRLELSYLDGMQGIIFEITDPETRDALYRSMISTELGIIEIPDPNKHYVGCCASVHVKVWEENRVWVLQSGEVYRNKKWICIWHPNLTKNPKEIFELGQACGGELTNQHDWFRNDSAFLKVETDT